MPTTSKTEDISFHSITPEDCNAVQAITMHSGLRNCNYTFSNMIGWKFLFDTEVCIRPGIVMLRLHFGGRSCGHLICSAQPPAKATIEALRANAAQTGQPLTLLAIEDSRAEHLRQEYGEVISIEPQRNSYDYIYSRHELETLKGKNLKSKRNHVNKFLSEHPDFEYRELVPQHFKQCMQLEERWQSSPHENPIYGDTITSERKMIECIFDNWERLDMTGGAIFVGDKMVAFSFGSAVTTDTFDTCVEKADRSVDGAFNIINQQMAAHLPEQFKYINREEDMGIEGLRKSKSSYHPVELLSYNIITFPMP